jgi:uncharacterized protein
MLDAFEWDADKALINLAERQISFSFAAKVFTDPFAVDFEDVRKNYGERRHVIIGNADNVTLFVAYTRRGENYRIISARKARRDERKYYHSQDAEGWHSDTGLT